MTTEQPRQPGILTQDAPRLPPGGGAVPGAATAQPAPRPDARPPFAHWWRRVAAALLDGWIVATVSFLLGGRFDTSWSVSLANEPRVHAPVAGWFVSVAALLVLQAYTGSTPGKRAMGIAIVREADDRPLGLLRTVGREVAHFLDVLLLVGYLRPLWHPRRRTFADSLASSDARLTRAPERHPAVAWLAAHRVPLLPGTVATSLAGAACTVALLALLAVHEAGSGADATCQGDLSIQASANGGPALGYIGPTPGGGWTEETTRVDEKWLTSPRPRLLEARLITQGWTAETRLGVRRSWSDQGEAMFWWVYGGPVTTLTAVLGPARSDAAGVPDDARSIHLSVDVSRGPNVTEAGIDHGTVRVSSLAPGIIGVSFVPDRALVVDDDFVWRAAVEPAAGAGTACGVA